MYKAYKYRIYPNHEQKTLIAKHIGSTRWIYNYALDKKIKAYQTEKVTLSRFDIQKDLPILKKNKDTLFLKEVNSQSLQASLENLDKSFTKFFRDKKGFPKFKSKHENRQSFSIPANTRVDFENNTINIPKVKTNIKCKLHRKFTGAIKTSTISRTPTGKYFISILVDTENNIPKKKTIVENQAIGLDLGIKTFAVLSNGVEIQNNKYLKKSLRKLKREQRWLSRKVKGSCNRNKQRIKVALVHEKVSNKRNDFLHKTTKYLVDNHDTICLETLNVKGMVKNHKLAQALNDVSFGKFNELIDYKSEWYGNNILRIGLFQPSSKMCSCGIVNKELNLSQREWTCKSCNTTHNRDLLAANNIKSFAFVNLKNTEGISGINACGDERILLSVNQEATTSLGLW